MGAGLGDFSFHSVVCQPEKRDGGENRLGVGTGMGREGKRVNGLIGLARDFKCPRVYRPLSSLPESN